mmetsp:Transcript_46679/g.111862  ORF Transcript_46679/g.111862 Transcript_46679/m.111862 type:complete len:239 (-) Transcript_46679:806-1522(-)
MPCFFLPAESLSSFASPSKVAALTISSASSTFSPLSRAPPPLTSRRTSDLLFANSSRMKRSISSTPSPASAALSCTRGSASVLPPPPPPPPLAKSDSAVAWMSSSTAAPCSMRVASSARTFLAWLTSAPLSASRLSISARGSSVKMRRKRPTSASSVLRQNCQYAKGVSRSALSHTAPSAVLPIFLPSEVVSSGAVQPKSAAPSALRASSTPLMMLPHWSEPPNWSSALCRRWSSRKS